MLDESRLALIRRWSMEGARADIAVERVQEPARTTSATERPPVLVKPAGGNDWRPLLAEPTHA